MKKTQQAVAKAVGPHIYVYHKYPTNKQLKCHKIQRKAKLGICLIISNHTKVDIY